MFDRPEVGHSNMLDFDIVIIAYYNVGIRESSTLV